MNVCADLLFLCNIQILFKLDNKSGNCEHLEIRKLFSEKNDSLDLRQFTPDMVTSMCIVAGCDYLVRTITSHATH